MHVSSYHRGVQIKPFHDLVWTRFCHEDNLVVTRLDPADEEHPVFHR